MYHHESCSIAFLVILSRSIAGFFLKSHFCTKIGFYEDKSHLFSVLGNTPETDRCKQFLSVFCMSQ